MIAAVASLTPSGAGPAATVAPDREPADSAATHSGGAYAVLMGGYPLAWAFGLAPVYYLMVAVPMVLWLLRHRPLRIPPGTVLFALFLVIVGASFTQLDSVGRMAVYGLRTSWYLCAFVTFLYLARHRGPAARGPIMKGLVLLWVLVVAGGYLALVAPELQWSTPIANILPGVLADNDFIEALIKPRASEIQVFRFEGVTLYRPAAPFAYTNAWGSTLALLTPFMVAAIHDRRIGIPRKLLVPLLMAGVVPFYVALNRGSWLTLAIGICYGIVRHGIVTRKLLPILALVALTALGAAVAVSTGAVADAGEQLQTRAADSNETRSSLYLQTLEKTAESPLVGYGSTRSNPADPNGPPLGTHGQLWAVLFAHGYLGAALYVLFFGTAFVRTKPRDPVAHWAKVSLLIGLLQMPIYGHLPHQLFVMMGAVALSAWKPEGPGPAGP